MMDEYFTQHNVASEYFSAGATSRLRSGVLRNIRQSLVYCSLPAAGNTCSSNLCESLNIAKNGNKKSGLTYCKIWILQC